MSRVVASTCLSERRRTASLHFRARRRGRHTRIERVNQAIHGFEAGVRNFWAFFRRRRPPQSRRGADDYDWSIELVTLGGAIPDIRSELMNLSPARPPRRRPAPAPRPTARPEPQTPRPEPHLPRPEPH